MAVHSDTLLYIFKPLLIISLLACFITNVQSFHSVLKQWMIGALSASIAGDTLLLFANKNELFFIAGLAAFLIAHVFYIICFHKIKINEQLKGNRYAIMIVAVYFTAIMSLLIPHLGGLKIPVILYGLVISFMLFVALQLRAIKQGHAGSYIVAGAVLFIISDTTLAINKFYQPVSCSDWTIMVTYIAAQFCIVTGISRFIRGTGIKKM